MEGTAPEPRLFRQWHGAHRRGARGSERITLMEKKTGLALRRQRRVGLRGSRVRNGADRGSVPDPLRQYDPDAGGASAFRSLLDLLDRAAGLGARGLGAMTNPCPLQLFKPLHSLVAVLQALWPLQALAPTHFISASSALAETGARANIAAAAAASAKLELVFTTLMELSLKRVETSRFNRVWSRIATRNPADGHCRESSITPLSRQAHENAAADSAAMPSRGYLRQNACSILTRLDVDVRRSPAGGEPGRAQRLHPGVRCGRRVRHRSRRRHDLRRTGDRDGDGGPFQWHDGARMLRLDHHRRDPQFSPTDPEAHAE